MPTSFRLSAFELLQLLVFVVFVFVVSSSASVSSSSFDLAAVVVVLRYKSGAKTNGTASRGNSSRSFLKNCDSSWGVTYSRKQHNKYCSKSKEISWRPLVAAAVAELLPKYELISSGKELRKFSRALCLSSGCELWVTANANMHSQSLLMPVSLATCPTNSESANGFRLCYWEKER